MVDRLLQLLSFYYFFRIAVNVFIVNSPHTAHVHMYKYAFFAGMASV